MNGQEAIERIKKSHYTAIAVMGCERDYETEKAIEIVEKEHKVLEIIKEKCVDVFRINYYITSNRIIELEEYKRDRKLTEEEFSLLKEVLE